VRFDFPSLCFDQFYKDPDSVREYALSLDGYTNMYGAHPGLRCRMLYDYDKQFYRSTVDKFLSLYMLSGVSCNCSTYFQKIHRFSSDPNDPVNQGWVHHDGVVNIAGVIYLDPEPVSDNGTSFYNPKGNNFRFNNVLEGDPPEYERIMGSSANTSGDTNYCKIDDINWYRENIVKNNEQFELKMEVKNCYNRCIAYSGQQLHGQSNYWMPNDDDFRLAQVYFVYDLKLPPNLMTSSRLDMFPV
tara:strand:- start:10 stop:738 length:729 start_codon:yes stop_codon:yes gene_type:complete